jgi:hypothetical protein
MFPSGTDNPEWGLSMLVPEASASGNDRLDLSSRSDEPPPKKRFGYKRSWVEGQIKLCLRLMNWTSPSGWLNPHTGELLPYNASLEELVNLLVSGAPHTPG